MKKLLVMTVTTALSLMTVCTSAFAAVNMTASKSNDGKITINVTGLTSGEESTLLVVDEDTALSTIADNTSAIRHIDQMTVTEEGKAEYTFDAGNAKNIDIYSGYTSMPTGSDPLKKVIEEESSEQPSNPSEGSYKLGDVNNDSKINITDASMVVDYILNRTPFYNANTSTLYEYGKNAADVNSDGKINITDFSMIIDYILNKTPFQK